MNCLIENGYINGSYIECYKMLHIAQGGLEGFSYEILKICLGFISGVCLALFVQYIQHKFLIHKKNKAVRVEMEGELEKLKFDINKVAGIVIRIMSKDRSIDDIRLYVPTQRNLILLEKNIEEIYLKSSCNSRKRIKPTVLYLSSLENIRKQFGEKSRKYFDYSVNRYEADIEYAEFSLKYICCACKTAMNIKAYLDNEELDARPEAGEQHVIAFCEELGINYKKIVKFAHQ